MQKIEFELLDLSREKPGVQQLQYEDAPRWPYPPVRHYDQAACEMQYRAFRDAYTRYESDAEGNCYVNRLTDSELRMRWLDYYTEFGQPTQAKIADWAREVSRGISTTTLAAKYPWLPFVALLFIIVLLLSH